MSAKSQLPTLGRTAFGGVAGAMLARLHPQPADARLALLGAAHIQRIFGDVGEDVKMAAFEALLRERSQRLADHEAGRRVLTATEADKVRVEIATLKQAIAYRRDRD